MDELDIFVRRLVDEGKLDIKLYENECARFKIKNIIRRVGDEARQKNGEFTYSSLNPSSFVNKEGNFIASSEPIIELAEKSTTRSNEDWRLYFDQDGMLQEIDEFVQEIERLNDEEGKKSKQKVVSRRSSSYYPEGPTGIEMKRKEEYRPGTIFTYKGNKVDKSPNNEKENPSTTTIIERNSDLVTASVEMEKPWIHDSRIRRDVLIRAGTAESFGTFQFYTYDNLEQESLRGSAEERREIVEKWRKIRMNNVDSELGRMIREEEGKGSISLGELKSIYESTSPETTREIIGKLRSIQREQVKEKENRGSEKE